MTAIDFSSRLPVFSGNLNEYNLHVIYLFCIKWELLCMYSVLKSQRIELTYSWDLFFHRFRPVFRVELERGRYPSLIAVVLFVYQVRLFLCAGHVS